MTTCEPLPMVGRTTSPCTLWPMDFTRQPVSVAGLKATGRPCGFWLYHGRVHRRHAPGMAVIENVPGLRRLGLADVLGDLDRLGYRARPGFISACEMGAPHPRRRLFTLAHAEGIRCGQGRPRRPDLDAPSRAAEQTPLLAHANGVRAEPAGRGWWDTEPGVARMADGIPERVDRTRGLGKRTSCRKLPSTSGA